MKTKLIVLAVLIAAAAIGQTPDQQLGFAETLDEEGSTAFALLEFKRFVYLYPEHPKVPEARLRTAVLYVTYLGDLQKGQAELAVIRDKHPGTPEAKQAGDLNDFIEVHSDFQGEPLVTFLKARAAESRQRFEAALSAYLNVIDSWPKAKLADDALLAAIKLQLHDLERADDARQSLRRFNTAYSDSPLKPDIAFEEAALVELTQGPRQGIQAYRDVARRHPDTEAARRAETRIEELRKHTPSVERQYDPGDALEYRTVREYYQPDNQLNAIITIPAQASERNVRATLEAALIALIDKRRERDQRVRVEGYFNYPVTKAGRVSWQPGQAPAYKIERRRGEDILKDAIFEILR